MSSCPFCGSTETEPIVDHVRYEHAVACRQCGARGPVANAPAVARLLWSQRQADDQPE